MAELHIDQGSMVELLMGMFPHRGLQHVTEIVDMFWTEEAPGFRIMDQCIDFFLSDVQNPLPEDITVPPAANTLPPPPGNTLPTLPGNTLPTLPGNLLPAQPDNTVLAPAAQAGPSHMADPAYMAGPSHMADPAYMAGPSPMADPAYMAAQPQSSGRQASSEVSFPSVNYIPSLCMEAPSLSGAPPLSGALPSSTFNAPAFFEAPPYPQLPTLLPVEGPPTYMPAADLHAPSFTEAPPQLAPNQYGHAVTMQTQQAVFINNTSTGQLHGSITSTPHNHKPDVPVIDIAHSPAASAGTDITKTSVAPSVIDITQFPTCSLPTCTTPNPAVVDIEQTLVKPPTTDDYVHQILSCFTEADPQYVRGLVEKYVDQLDVVLRVSNDLIENEQTYPRRPKPSLVEPPRKKFKRRDYEDCTVPMNSAYTKDVEVVLQNEFYLVPMPTIRKAMSAFKFHYIPIKRFLDEAMRSVKMPSSADDRSSPQSATTSLRGPQDKSATPPLKEVQVTQCGTSSTLHTTTIQSSTSITVKQSATSSTAKLSTAPGVTSSPTASEKYIFLSCIGFSHKVKLLKMGRRRWNYKDQLQSEELKAEMAHWSDTMNKQKSIEETPADALIECGCCFSDFCIDEMVQCADGHLFCESCLREYTKEATFGQGKASLHCMSAGCSCTYPRSQLEKTVPPHLLEQFEDRVLQESLNLADIPDLVRCPSDGCEFAAILDPQEKVLQCLSCLKETCRYCEVDWSEHWGIPCSELEHRDETNLRTSYEERMTQAKVRKCSKCKASFMKTDGCNKMTCRCGQTMCYICRTASITYNHFCQHARDPGSKCTSCTACSLWTNPEEDDERAVMELKKSAQEERTQKGYDPTKVIG